MRHILYLSLLSIVLSSKAYCDPNIVTFTIQGTINHIENTIIGHNPILSSEINLYPGKEFVDNEFFFYSKAVKPHTFSRLLFDGGDFTHSPVIGYSYITINDDNSHIHDAIFTSGLLDATVSARDIGEPPVNTDLQFSITETLIDPQHNPPAHQSRDLVYDLRGPGNLNVLSNTEFGPSSGGGRFDFKDDTTIVRHSDDINAVPIHYPRTIIFLDVKTISIKAEDSKLNDSEAFGQWYTSLRDQQSKQGK